MPPLAVGAAIAAGLADVAAGSASTAAALGLGFVALGRERVVLLLRDDFAEGEVGRALIEVARLAGRPVTG